MNVGKTLFAQVMDFLPWKTFHRIVDRYWGDHFRLPASTVIRGNFIALPRLAP